MELTSPASLFLGFVASSSLVYEEIARIMFKSLKSETLNPIFLIFYFIYSKPQTHLPFYEELARPVFGFLVTSTFTYEKLARPTFLFPINTHQFASQIKYKLTNLLLKSEIITHQFASQIRKI